jgi:hypothetical protein
MTGMCMREWLKYTKKGVADLTWPRMKASARLKYSASQSRRTSKVNWSPSNEEEPRVDDAAYEAYRDGRDQPVQPTTGAKEQRLASQQPPRSR